MSRAADPGTTAAALRAAIPAPKTASSAAVDGPPSIGGEPCLHCGHPVAARLMGCKGGHCPNCRHPYPHGDCSD